MKKIAILTHNAVRDPITDDCLAVELKKRGHSIFRRAFLRDDKNMILCIKPDIVVLPELRCEYSRDYAKQCKEWGIQVVVRPCEVGISEESLDLISEDYRRAIYGNWPVSNYMDLMLCWGPKMQELFCKHGNIEKSKTVSVGGLAFDQFLIPPPPENVQRTEKRRVLFATGFAYADRNPEYSVPEALENDPLHRNMVATDLKARSEWFKVIKRLWAEHGNDWEILVKIHPGERPEVYTAVLKDTVSICPPVPPVRAIQHADIVVHAGSTMAFEAHLMNKPAINLLNVCQDVIVSKISPNANSYEELVSMMLSAVPNRGCELKSNANPDIIDILTRDYYGTCDGKASERAAEEIDKLPENEPNVPDAWPPYKEMIYRTQAILTDAEVWSCPNCVNNYHVQGPREMVKCPYCGVANVKTMKANT
jgi:surface carbohydrate biosynthesis protein